MTVVRLRVATCFADGRLGAAGGDYYVPDAEATVLASGDAPRARIRRIATAAELAAMRDADQPIPDEDPAVA